ncbi:MAG TPA: hypothetical protein VF885_00655 [Arthrobacter sp.]
MSIPARRRNTEGIHASMLPSACTIDEVATHNRADPYWDQLWAPGSQAVWATAAMERVRVDAGTGPVRRRHRMPRAEAMRQLTSNKGRADRLAGWSVLDSWRTVSAEQMAAFTGSAVFLDPDCNNIAASFCTDVLDLGTYSHPSRRLPGMNRGTLYRPGNSDAFEQLIAPTLTFPEWVSVTGGTPWSTGGQYDRHNMLAAELALRAAEYLPVGAILGEKHASVDLLAGSGLGRSVKNPDNRRADGVLIRPDGMRIAYELTATASTAFENKVRRWARIISERPLETSGLTIVFIAAPHPDRADTGRDPRSEIYRRLTKVLTEFPGTGKDSPAARIGVATWDEWFPARHEISESFFTLTADFALGDGRGAQKWVPRELLGGYDFEPWHTFDAKAVVENAPLIAASPHWLRGGEHTHLIGTPMERAGEEAPQPGPVRPELGMPLPLGAARGVSGDAKLPPRLRIEG